jgi:hypothetical protein
MRRYRLGSHARYGLKVQRISSGSSEVGNSGRAAYFAVTSGTITDEMVNDYINEQEGEPIEDNSRFQIDPS